MDICRVYLILSFLITLVIGGDVAAQPVSQNLPAGSPPLVNPLKGWAPYFGVSSSVQPTSLAFIYVPWRILEPREGKFTFRQWEARIWNHGTAKGKRIIFRVFLDFPGTRTGVPSWLLKKGVTLRPYPASASEPAGVSPDYENPLLVSALERLISALGKRYDGNPRVAGIELGMLGFWGEWHTSSQPQLFASEIVQNDVLEAYQKSFTRTLLLGRYGEGLLASRSNLGFHDDYFPLDTDANIYRAASSKLFLPQLSANNLTERWRSKPIGGELVPGEARRFLTRDWDLTLEMVQKAHISWLGPYSAPLVPLRGSALRNARTLARTMGYSFQLQTVLYTPHQSSGDESSVTISGLNNGVAPFYEAWPVQFAWVKSGKVVKREGTEIDVRTWQPGQFSSTATLHAPSTPGHYRLAIGIVDPLTRKPSVHFANKLKSTADWTELARVNVH